MRSKASERFAYMASRRARRRPRPAARWRFAHRGFWRRLIEAADEAGLLLFMCFVVRGLAEEAGGAAGASAGAAVSGG